MLFVVVWCAQLSSSCAGGSSMHAGLIKSWLRTWVDTGLRAVLPSFRGRRLSTSIDCGQPWSIRRLDQAQRTPGFQARHQENCKLALSARTGGKGGSWWTQTPKAHGCEAGSIVKRHRDPNPTRNAFPAWSSRWEDHECVSRRLSILCKPHRARSWVIRIQGSWRARPTSRNVQMADSNLLSTSPSQPTHRRNFRGDLTVICPY